MFKKLINEEPTIEGDFGPINLPTTKRATKYAQTLGGPAPTLLDDPETVAQQEKITRVTYHMTEVFTFNHRTREVSLNTGGWFTVTTKQRMNMMSEELNLGFGISQVRGNWYIHSNIFPQKLEFTKDWITFNVDTGVESDHLIE